MSNGSNIEKIDLDKVDWLGSREFFESLSDELRDLDDKDERYDFTWVGKRKSIIEAGTPINKTFRPDVENSKNWSTTEDLFIEGDNLDALKILQESYLGKVKMIYIDPPYNTGKDFVYHDSFKTSTKQYDEDTEYKDEDGNIQFKKNEKTNGRYHSDWLSMMYPRLKLARNLLVDDGVIFISINEYEQANLKEICDEVFGEDNYIETFVWNKNATKNLSKTTSTNHEYIVCYAKNKTEIEQEGIFRISKRGLDEVKNIINTAKTEGVTPEIAQRRLIEFFKLHPQLKGISMYKNIDKQWRVFRSSDISAPIAIGHSSNTYTIIHPITKKPVKAPATGWRFNEAKMQSLIAQGLILFGKDETTVPQYKRLLINVETEVMKSLINDFTDGKKEIMRLFNGKAYFENPKPTTLVQYLLNVTNDSPDNIILDFFAGSGTTAHAIMQLNAEDGGNRKWIMVQLPEKTDEKSEAFKAGYKTISEIARERIRRAGNKIASEHPDAKTDYGFRALRIDNTNYKEIYKSVGETQQSMLSDLVDNVKEDRSDLDLLFGVLTQSAFELNHPLETRTINDSTIYLYDYFGEVSGLIACFEKNINEETIKEIANLKPLTAVFRESSFADSQAKINLAEHFRVISPETKLKVV